MRSGAIPPNPYDDKSHSNEVIFVYSLIDRLIRKGLTDDDIVHKINRKLGIPMDRVVQLIIDKADIATQVEARMKDWGFPYEPDY